MGYGSKPKPISRSNSLTGKVLLDRSNSFSGWKPVSRSNSYSDSNPLGSRMSLPTGNTMSQSQEIVYYDYGVNHDRTKVYEYYTTPAELDDVIRQYL